MGGLCALFPLLLLPRVHFLLFSQWTKPTWPSQIFCETRFTDRDSINCTEVLPWFIRLTSNPDTLGGIKVWLLASSSHRPNSVLTTRVWWSKERNKEVKTYFYQLLNNECEKTHVLDSFERQANDDWDRKGGGRVLFWLVLDGATFYLLIELSVVAKNNDQCSRHLAKFYVSNQTLIFLFFFPYGHITHV